MAPSPFAELDEIRHVLQPHYPALRAIPSRAKLLRSPLYASIAPQLTPLLTAVERGCHGSPTASCSPPGELRAVAWNIQRGRHLSLGMHYAFGVSYLVLGDDVLENQEGAANTLALAGAAVLSRWPLGTVYNLDLPELRDKFSSKSEKRLGKKRALAAEILLPSGSLWVSTCHLDSNASPTQRSRQLAAATSTPRPTTLRAPAR